MPPSICVTLTTSRKVRPPTSTGRGSSAANGRRPSTARSIAFSAEPRSREWPLTPWKSSRAFRLPRQPAWIVLSVGSSRIASAASCDEPATRRRAPGAGCPPPAAPRAEEEEREVDGGLGAARRRARARARASPRARPSCRSRRARARRRPRSGRGCCPARARCRSGRRARRAARPSRLGGA